MDCNPTYASSNLARGSKFSSEDNMKYYCRTCSKVYEAEDAENRIMDARAKQESECGCGGVLMPISSIKSD